MKTYRCIFTAHENGNGKEHFSTEKNLSPCDHKVGGEEKFRPLKVTHTHTWKRNDDRRCIFTAAKKCHRYLSPCRCRWWGGWPQGRAWSRSRRSRCLPATEPGTNGEPKVNQTLEPLSSLVYVFFATSPIRALISAYMCSASHSHRWRDCDFIPNSYAMTGYRTQVSSVAPLWGTITQDALQTELPRPRLYLCLCNSPNTLISFP